jgi:hypothetical protein
MKITGWAAVMGAVLLAGACASSKGKPTYTTELGSIAWTEMAGLTQDELRGRLGLTQTTEHIVDRARLDGEVLETSIGLLSYLVRTGCGDRKDYRGRVSLSHQIVALYFRDGRISGHAARGRPPAGTGPDKPLVATCTETPDMTLDHMLSNSRSEGAQVLAALVILPVYLAQKAVTDSGQAERTTVFSELKLGEAPPGGLDAWAKKNAKQVSVSTAPDGLTEIKIHSPSNGINFYRYAYLMDGKVVELRGSPPGRCVMQADRSMQCDIADLLQPS